jgi:hypothetical protein
MEFRDAFSNYRADGLAFLLRMTECIRLDLQTRWKKLCVNTVHDGLHTGMM